MPQIDIDLKTLVGYYEPTLGIEGAQRLVYEALTKVGMRHKEIFTLDEATRVCHMLASEPGFVATTANIILARLRLKCWKSKSEDLLHPSKDNS